MPADAGPAATATDAGAPAAAASAPDAGGPMTAAEAAARAAADAGVH